jgi:amidase
MSRTVKDAAYILQAIAGADSHDNYTFAIPNRTMPDYIAACNLSALAGSRLGVPRNVISLLSHERTGPIVESFEQALVVLQAAGATIVEDANFTAAVEFWYSTLWQTVINADFVADMQSYLRSLSYNPRDIKSLSDIREFTKSFPLEEYPARDTSGWDQALLLGWNNTDPRFWPVY